MSLHLLLQNIDSILPAAACSLLEDVFSDPDSVITMSKVSGYEVLIGNPEFQEVPPPSCFVLVCGNMSLQLVCMN